MIKKPLPALPAEKKRRRIGFLPCLSLLLLLLVAGSYVGLMPQTLSVSSVKRELPIYCVAREDNVIAISFDASWGGEKTLKILDILDEYEVKTTFFLVDIWVKKFPELAQEIVRRGHEIGNHSTTHPYMSKLGEAQIVAELSTMSERVFALTGTRPTLFRPPYGDYNNRLVLTARAQGYEVIQWSVDSQDWKNRGAQDIIQRATKAQSGDIVLFHNDSQYIVEALPTVLENFRQRGLTVVKVSDILPKEKGAIDIQGRMHSASTKIPEV